MKKGKGLPTTEMRDDMPRYDGPLIEEVAPNSLTNKRISELAFQSVFMFQPDVVGISPKTVD